MVSADTRVRDRPIHRVFPRLDVPWVRLGDWPTPVEAFGEGFLKRDDLSSPVYGGNKVRTLEVLFGEALAEGATHVYATGAFGTNHGAATLLHAPRVGLRPGLVLFPQPTSSAARANFEVLLGAEVGRRPEVMVLPHWSALPWGMARVRARHRRHGGRPFVMVPGGATPRGALGYVSAGFEVAEQIEAGVLPAPERIVLPVGSTCTTAGLLLGTQLCAALGFGWRRPPVIQAVRVTPWPVTAPGRIVSLAQAAGRELARQARAPEAALSRARLGSTLEVDGRWLGWGYGRETAAGKRAVDEFRAKAGFELDTTYSAKGAAAFLEAIRRPGGGPTLFWSTKSTAPLPEPARAALSAVNGRATRWLARADRSLP
ncbi:MAG: hypothetical protein CMN30_20745 [Sandaracinus sp.]|nr:hypothetical protein [Sandaracinus sp.]